MKTERLEIRVTPETKTILQQLADAEGRSMSNYVERLILAAHKKTQRDDYCADHMWD